MENLNTFTPLPPGYRFHPTDEELVDYYLRRKVNSRRIETDAIKEVDLYKIEPWDLQEICRIRNNHEQNEWYFFSHKDKKYPTGTRTNRATAAGFWKATGRDKAIYLKHELIGMRKTLVFYKGRAPNGQKSDWIMHEYRLESDENGAPQEEGWAVCRVFKKRAPTMRNTMEHEIPCWYDEQVSFMPDLDSPRPTSQSNNLIIGYNSAYTCRRELDYQRRFPLQIPHDHLMNMPVMENSKVVLANSSQGTSNSNNALIPYGLDMMNNQGNSTMEQFHGDYNGPMVLIGNHGDDQGGALDQVTDWRVLDKFVASQLSHDQDVRPKGNNDNYSSSTVEPEILPTPMSDHSNKEEKLPDNASTSTSSSQIDVWK